MGTIYIRRIGTFLSEEPNGSDGPNAYKYARNNPLFYSDPDGRNPLIVGGDVAPCFEARDASGELSRPY